MLSKSDPHCFTIGAYRTLIDSIFIFGVIRFDARQEQLESATRTTPSGNGRQWGRIRTIWLRHSAPSYNRLSVADACAQGLGRRCINRPLYWSVCLPAFRLSQRLPQRTYVQLFVSVRMSFDTSGLPFLIMEFLPSAAGMPALSSRWP